MAAINALATLRKLVKGVGEPDELGISALYFTPSEKELLRRMRSAHNGGGLDDR